MRNLAIGALVFVAGWGLGWYSYQYLGTHPEPTAPSSISVPPGPADPATEAGLMPQWPGQEDDLAALLQRNDFEAAVARYETWQDQADATAMATARTLILAHADRLIEAQRFSEAEQLLQRFLVAAYRDVEARLLLAAALHGQQDIAAAIDLLYEARGVAYRPAMLQRITARIRSLVAELAQSLQGSNDQSALLRLYQHLVQLEPDHAPWFMQLAAAQLALEDHAAARRSLQLVVYDPDVGAQAQALLVELDQSLARMQAAEPQADATGIVGIPLQQRGNHYLVDAQAASGRSIRLLIDTGASLTILTPEVFARRGIGYRDTGRTGTFHTANGSVRAPVYRLDSLSVGDWYVNDLEVGVLDLGGGAMDGLLGMNFLRHFRFFIDQNKAELRLSVN